MRHVITVVALLAACACGDSKTVGGGVDPLPPQITTSTTVIIVGQSVQFAASPSDVQWGGDAPGVATIDSSGRVTGIATGHVTIWAQNAGGRTTRLLRVVPAYAGSWQGTYSIQDCQATGDFVTAGFCETFSRGLILYNRYDLTQSDDRVSGTFTLGSVIGNLDAAVIADDGTLPFTGSVDSGSTHVRLEQGRLDCNCATSVSGQFEQRWSDATMAGQARVTCRIDTLVLSNPAASIFQVPGHEALTLSELMRRVSRR